MVKLFLYDCHKKISFHSGWSGCGSRSSRAWSSIKDPLRNQSNVNPFESGPIRHDPKRDEVNLLGHSWRHWYRYRILVTSLRSLFCIEGRRWKIYEERRRKKLKFNFRLKEAFWDEKMSLWEIIPIDIILLLRAVSWKN